MYQNPRAPYRRSGAVVTSRPRKGNKQRKLFGTIIIVLAIIGSVYGLLQFTKDTPGDNRSKTAGRITQQNTGTNSQPSEGFDKTAHSTTDPASIWVIANKQHPLNPKTYKPSDLVVPNVSLRSNISGDERLLRAEPAKALESLVTDAANADVHFNLQSGYRSYNFQVTLYNGYVKQQGQAAADRTSARPGYSEHQSGFAADLGGTSKPACNVEKCFAQTPEGIWLAANAYTYGFIIRYTETKEAVTGYDYEPWHIRYVGTDLSNELHAKGIETLEEFFNVTGGTSY